MVMRFWLVTTDHLEDRLWFKDNQDFMAAMNLVAVLSVKLNGRIISFVLMSNHVHFVLQCTAVQARSFINSFKRMYSRYYSLKYKVQELLRENNIDIRELKIEDESLERGIAYVQMNSVAAKICLDPSGYLWGTGKTFFNQNKPRYVSAGTLSARALIKLTHSKTQIPKDYLIDERGFIAPESYVAVEFVEKLFKTPSRMNYFLKNSSKAKRQKEGPAFRDQLIIDGAKDLCITLFHKNSLDLLDEYQQAEVLRQLRYRFSADPNQLSRVCGIEYNRLCGLLELFQ